MPCQQGVSPRDGLDRGRDTCGEVWAALRFNCSCIDAKEVNDLIAQNARVAQNQTEYDERYEALDSRFEETERRRDELADRINQIMIRRRKLERFIETVEGLPEFYTEFDVGQ